MTDTLIGLSKSSYWLSLRLTRFRAHPPHTYVHVHLSIRQENFYFPQCQDLYQTVRVYDYATQYPFAQIQAKTLNKQSHLQYSLVDEEKIFAMNKQTGFLHLLPSIHTQRRLKSDYLLTTNVFDLQSKLSVSCYVKVQLIRRRQLIPQFLSSTVYKADLPEIPAGSSRLRQRLFQVVALLNPQVYDRKLEIRYRFTDLNHHFIINRQTGYIAAKQPLDSYTTYEFNVRTDIVLCRERVCENLFFSCVFRSKHLRLLIVMRSYRMAMKMTMMNIPIVANGELFHLVSLYRFNFEFCHCSHLINRSHRILIQRLISIFFERRKLVRLFYN